MNERDEIERGQGAERSALPVPPKNQLNRKVFLNNDKTQQVLKVLLLTKFDGIPLEDYFLSVLLTTLIISKKPGNTGISRDIRTEFTTDLLLSD